MGKKKFQDNVRYNPIESQLAADVSSAAPAAESLPKPVKPAPRKVEKPPREVARAKAKPEGPAPKPDLQVVDRPELKKVTDPALVEREVVKKIRVAESAWMDLDDLLRDVRAQTGTQIPVSIATRAAWGLMVQARAELIAYLREHPLGHLPSTKDPVAFAAFEEQLRDAFAAAYRKLPRNL